MTVTDIAIIVGLVIKSMLMIFYVIYSGIMMQLLKQSGLVCSGINKKGEQVDIVAKYLIMAKLCFATSIIFAVLNA